MSKKATVQKTKKQTEAKAPVELIEEDLDRLAGASRSSSEVMAWDNTKHVKGWDNTKHVKWESKL